MSPDLIFEFGERMRENSARVFRLSYSVLRNREDAEEVAQEAFIKAYYGFITLRDRQQFRAWVSRITWRLALNRWRDDQPRQRRESMGFKACMFPTPIAAVLGQERSDRLWRAIRALPDEFREVVVLTTLEERRVAEVAVLLQVPEGTVKSRLLRARRRMKTLLETE